MLVLDLSLRLRLPATMTLSEEERAEVPQALFDLASRRLEYGLSKSIQGAGQQVSRDRLLALSARLHDVGQDLKVIADAIAALLQDENRV